MFDVESVGRVARIELIRTLAEIVKKFEEFASYNHEKSQEETRVHYVPPAFEEDSSESDVSCVVAEPGVVLSEFLKRDDNCTRLFCTRDVFKLLSRLFPQHELLDVGFKSIEVLAEVESTPSSSPSNKFSNTKETPNNIDIYLIRPTITDSKLFKNHLGIKRYDMLAVVCLPLITDMYAETLQLLMGDEYFVQVADGEGNKFFQRNNVLVFSCEIHAVPIEMNALSMFMSNCYTDYYFSGDPTIPWFFAKAVEYLEGKFLGGAIAQLNGIGELSKFVLQLLVQGRREHTAEFILECIDNASTNCDADQSLNIELDSIVDKKIGSSEDGILLGVSSECGFGVVIDRHADLITPMCSNFTYQGLLDSLFGIDDNSIQVETAIIDGTPIPERILPDLFAKFSKQNSRPNLRKITLDSFLYKEIKWLNYNEVGPYLHSRALGSKNQEMPTGLSTAADLTAIDEMEDFVLKYKSQQEEYLVLSQHVNLMSYISRRLSDDIHKMLRYFEDGILQGTIINTTETKGLANITAKLLFKSEETPLEYLLDLIYWNIPVWEIYRLLILWSQTNNGIQMSDYTNIQKAIMIQYGFSELLTLERILQSNMITICNNTDPSRWQKLCRRLNLLVDKDTATSDYSSVFGGYAPLSLRLSQMLQVSQGQGDVLNLEMGLLQSPLTLLKQSDVAQSDSYDTSTNGSVFIGFVGGVTLGEVAAVNLLRTRQPKHPLFILATDVVSAASILESLSDINL